MLSQLAAVFGLAALVLVMVYWINRAVRLFDQIIASGESAGVFLELSVLTLPNVIKLVLPVAAFASAVYVTNRLSSESELVIVQSTGFSPWRLSRPVLTYGIGVAIFASLLAHVLVPASLARLADRQADIAENVTARLLTDGQFLHPSDGVTFYIGSITPEGELKNVFLSDARREDRRLTYTAERALLVRDDGGPKLLMFEGMAQALDMETGRLAVTRFSDFAFDIAALLSVPKAGRRTLSELYTSELIRPSEDVLARARATPASAMIEAHSRITQSLLCIVAPLLGFATLIVGGFSRFGIWRQIVGAIAILVILQTLDTALADVALKSPSNWPVLYVPTLVALMTIAGLLTVAANPHLVRRRPRRPA